MILNLKNNGIFCQFFDEQNRHGKVTKIRKQKKTISLRELNIYLNNKNFYDSSKFLFF